MVGEGPVETEHGKSRDIMRYKLSNSNSSTGVQVIPQTRMCVDQDTSMFPLKALVCLSVLWRVLVLLEGEPSQPQISGRLKDIFHHCSCVGHPLTSDQLLCICSGHAPIKPSSVQVWRALILWTDTDSLSPTCLERYLVVMVQYSCLEEPLAFKLNYFK